MKHLAYQVCEVLFLPALFGIAFVYIWLLAPAGAAYPR